MGDSTHPLKTGQLVIEGDIVYLAYDENDPSNTDRTKINVGRPVTRSQESARRCAMARSHVKTTETLASSASGHQSGGSPTNAYSSIGVALVRRGKMRMILPMTTPPALPADADCRI